MPPVRFVWALDVLLAISILALLNAIALDAYQTAIFKAKANGQLMAAESWRGRVVEHFALTGDWTINAGDLPRDYASANLDAVKWTSGPATAGIVDGVIVTLGRYPEHLQGTALLTYRPVVAKGAEQPTVMWLCGHAPTPEGFEGPHASLGANLPDEQLFSMCRRGTAR